MSHFQMQLKKELRDLRVQNGVFPRGSGSQAGILIGFKNADQFLRQIDGDEGPTEDTFR